MTGQHPRPAGEEGFVVVFVALFLVVILGAAALAIDIGSLQAQRLRLKQVAEAAAIHGSEQLPGDVAQAEADAAAVISTNLGGTDLSNYTVAYNPDYMGSNTDLQVTITAQAATIFANVLGIHTSAVTASAAAKFVKGTPGTPEALFAGDTSCSGGIVIGKNNGTIDGDVHSNGSLNVDGNNNTIDSASYQKGCTGPTSSQIGGGPVTADLTALPYPETFGFPTVAQSTCCSQFAVCSGHTTTGDLTLTSASNGVICATNSITIPNSVTSLLTVTLIAPTITFPSQDSGNGNAGVDLQAAWPTSGASGLLLYATGSNPVNIASNGNTLTGVMYAPAAAISFSKNNDTINGFVEAWDITVGMNNFSVFTGAGPLIGGTAATVTPTE